MKSSDMLMVAWWEHMTGMLLKEGGRVSAEEMIKIISAKLSRMERQELRARGFCHGLIENNGEPKAHKEVK